MKIRVHNKTSFWNILIENPIFTGRKGEKVLKFWKKKLKNSVKLFGNSVTFNYKY